MNYLSSAGLKRMARGQLFGKLGTVIGAFLLHLVCLIPFIMLYFVSVTLTAALGMMGVSLFVIYIPEYVLLIITFLYMTVFFYGEDKLYLKIVCGQDAVFTDIFAGFKEGFLKIVGVGLLPSFIMSLFCVPFMVSMNKFIYEVYSDSELLSKLLSGMRVLDTGEIDSQTMAFMQPYARAIYFSTAFVILGMFITGIVFSQVLFLTLDYTELSVKQILSGNFSLLKGSLGRYAYAVVSFTPWFMLASMYCTCITALWVFPYFKATMANFYIDLMKSNENARQERQGYGA